MATLEQLEARIVSLENTRAAQTPIIQRHELALDQIKPMYNEFIDDTKEAFKSVAGATQQQVNDLFDDEKLTYATN